MLIGACKLVKERGLSTVLVSCQCKGKEFSLRKWILICLYMIFATFSKSGVARLFLGAVM